MLGIRCVFEISSRLVADDYSQLYCQVVAKKPDVVKELIERFIENTEFPGPNSSDREEES